MAARNPLLLLVLCASCASSAQRPEGSYAETLALTVDNDAFTGSDDSYTNGTALTWTSREIDSYPEKSFRRGLGEAGSFLPFIGDEGFDSFTALTLGQEIFTPEDIEASRQNLDDQPYAGLLFLQASYYAKNESVCHAWALRLGVVGPSAGAGAVQETVHEWIDDGLPQGWDNQLPDEPVVNVDYSAAFELTAGGPEEGANWRLVPMATGSLGNYFTGAGAAMYGEFGWNLPEAIGLVSFRRGVDPISAVDTGAQKKLSASLYLGAGGYAVAHFLPLDGTLFRESVSVESEPLVGFVTGGLALRYRRCSIGLLITSFTDQFEGQTSSTDFGTLSLTFGL